MSDTETQDAAASADPTRTSAAGRATAACRGGVGAGRAPTLGVRGTLRWLWTQLTSMRTALVLLFALAVAAVPGSLVPQRDVSPIRVSDFIAQNPRIGPLYDTLGLFHVYTSAWFSAIYLLLFVSLVGCIVPRALVYAKALRSPPPRTPSNLSRLPAYATAELSADPADLDDRRVLRAAATELGGSGTAWSPTTDRWRRSGAISARPATSSSM